MCYGISPVLKYSIRTGMLSNSLGSPWATSWEPIPLGSIKTLMKLNTLGWSSSLRAHCPSGLWTDKSSHPTWLRQVHGKFSFRVLCSFPSWPWEDELWAAQCEREGSSCRRLNRSSVGSPLDTVIACLPKAGQRGLSSTEEFHSTRRHKNVHTNRPSLVT